jgi:hypothetical protein
LHAPVAHLDRVLVSEAKGSGFDSRRAHHTSKGSQIKCCGPFLFLSVKVYEYFLIHINLILNMPILKIWANRRQFNLT